MRAVPPLTQYFIVHLLYLILKMVVPSENIIEAHDKTVRPRDKSATARPTSHSETHPIPFDPLWAAIYLFDHQN
jgi:hypothetical protein